ncbi:hypothetical protein EJB05_22116, partial [Eragrostis curvula]
MFAVNVRGTFLVCREAANRVLAHNGGRIVTFSSSIMGTLLPGYAAYTAANGTVEAMTRIMAKEVAAKLRDHGERGGAGSRAHRAVLRQEG